MLGTNHALSGRSAGTWEHETFAFADSFDSDSGRYRGLRAGQLMSLADADATGLLVQPDVARKQLDAESVPVGTGPSTGEEAGGETGRQPGSDTGQGGTPEAGEAGPRRFHGTVILDATRVGRDASRIADEVVAHLAGQVGADVTVTLDIEARLPDGASDHIVRTVTENSRTLKFTNHGFERE